MISKWKKEPHSLRHCFRKGGVFMKITNTTETSALFPTITSQQHLQINPLSCPALWKPHFIILHRSHMGKVGVLSVSHPADVFVGNPACCMSRQGWTSSVCVLSCLELPQLGLRGAQLCPIPSAFFCHLFWVFLQHFWAFKYSRVLIPAFFLRSLSTTQVEFEVAELSWCQHWVSSTHILQVTSPPHFTHTGVISEQNLNLHCIKSLRSVWAQLVSFPQICLLTKPGRVFCLAEFLWLSEAEKFWKQGFRINTWD